MKPAPIPLSPNPKIKAASVKLTAEQAKALKIYSNQNNVSAQDVLLAGLLATIPGFPK